MYKGFAILTGMLISIMILFNGILMVAIGNSPAVLVVHIIGLFCMSLYILVTKEKWISIKKIPIFYLLAGISGVATVYMTNISFITLGATLTLMLSMVGRIVTSTVIDHFGLMGMATYPFRPMKLIGLAIMLIGLMLIVIY